MKVLVATQETNGEKAGDFCYATEGELVYKAQKCGSEKHPTECRCHQSLCGANSRSFTNTVKVADVQGFIVEDVDAIDPTIKEMRAIAERYETGTVLEVRNNELFVRKGEEIWPEFIEDEV